MPVNLHEPPPLILFSHAEPALKHWCSCCTGTKPGRFFSPCTEAGRQAPDAPESRSGRGHQVSFPCLFLQTKRSNMQNKKTVHPLVHSLIGQNWGTGPGSPLWITTPLRPGSWALPCAMKASQPVTQLLSQMQT